MTAAGPSLVRRVALAAALAAALGGTVAALAAGFAARRLIAAREEAALRDAVQEVIDELHEADDDEGAGSAPTRDLQARLAHELEDLKLTGARAAVRRGVHTLAGDARLPQLAPGVCALADETTATRACAARYDDTVLTLLAPADAERARFDLVTRALWIGLLSAALLGGLLGGMVARWALAPLTLLRDRVREVKVEAPNANQLSTPLEQLELEELRLAVATLVEHLAGALAHAQGFAAEAAHELRTPLTSIAGELELMTESSAPPDAAALTRVRRQVSALVVLVQRLLILAQPNAVSQAQLPMLDLNDVVSDALDALPSVLRTRVTTRVDDDVFVRGDAALLQALVGNALDNALKFSDEHVELHVASAAGYAHLDVVDRGPGLSAADRERVFAPFYRTAAVRARGMEGHGLGLALIARVAQLHGGDAAFLDVPQGAMLRVRLRAWQPDRDT